MTERDLSEMSAADPQRWLKHYRGSREVRDDADRDTVKILISKLEAEIAKRGARGTP